jgi:hypothetical protein
MPRSLESVVICTRFWLVKIMYLRDERGGALVGGFRGRRKRECRIFNQGDMQLSYKIMINEDC